MGFTYTLTCFTLRATERSEVMPCGKKRKRQKIRTHKRKKMRRKLRHVKKRASGEIVGGERPFAPYYLTLPGKRF